jgi:uncharacterized protein (UPF0335 family)
MMARKLGKHANGSKPKKSTKERVKDTVAEVNRTNVTEDTKRQFLDDCQQLHTEMQLAQAKVREVSGRYRARLKDGEKNGVDAKAIAWVIAARKRDPEELAREIRATNEMAVIGKLNIGNGGNGDGKHADSEDIKMAKERGTRDGKKGVNKNDYADGSPEFLAYEGCYRIEQDALLTTLGRGGQQQAAAH